MLKKISEDVCKVGINILMCAAAIFFMACSGEDKDSSFVSNGISRGKSESLTLDSNESYAGLLKNIEIAILYRPASDTFIGRLKNEDAEAVCDITVVVVIDGSQRINMTQAGSPLQIDGLNPSGRQDFIFVVEGVAFSKWLVEIESFGCSSVEVDEENEEDEEHEGEENEEHEGEENESESGDESNPRIPLMEPFSGVFNNLNFMFAFEGSPGAFRGIVGNQTNQRVCQSRVEVHIAVGEQVVELGPTIGVDLVSGETINVVLQADDFRIDAYSLHPESSPCP